jgi:hypothetical protein
MKGASGANSTDIRMRRSWRTSLRRSEPALPYLMMQSATKAIACPGKHRVGR